MTRRILPGAVFTAEVTVIALAACFLASVLAHNTAVAIATGVTAALLANALLPCHCHPRRGHR